MGWGTARSLWERGLCVHVCVTGSVFWSGAWRAGKVWPETEEPKAGPSSAVQTLGVSRPFLLDEGLDDPVSQGPVNFDSLTFQAVVRAVLSVSLRGHRCRVCTCVCVCVCVCVCDSQSLASNHLSAQVAPGWELAPLTRLWAFSRSTEIRVPEVYIQQRGRGK